MSGRRDVPREMSYTAGDKSCRGRQDVPRETRHTVEGGSEAEGTVKQSGVRGFPLQLGCTILQKCTQITHLACNINLLKSLVCKSTPFSHHNLKELTLIEPIIPWELLLSHSAGRQLFNQLTHLCTNRGTKFVLPNFSFSSLTHLSFPITNFYLTQAPLRHSTLLDFQYCSKLHQAYHTSFAGH